MSCTPSNSAATSLIFSARSVARRSSSSTTSRLRSGPVASAMRSSSARTAGVADVRRSTSPANTTAAAGAPPMTEANDPSSASTVIAGLSALEKTTNAPPW